MGVMSGSNKAEGYRRLVQHDGPPGFLEETDPAGCDFVRDGRSMPPALMDHTTCPGLGLVSCERLAAAAAGLLLLVNVHKQLT